MAGCQPAGGTGQAHGGTKFEGFGLLVAGDVDRLLLTCSRLGDIRGDKLKPQLAFKPIEFCVGIALDVLVGQRPSFRDQRQPFVYLFRFPIDIS